MFNRRIRSVVGAIVTTMLVAACSLAFAHRAEPGRTVTLTVDERPFGVHVPPSYVAGKPTSLVVALHGWTGTSKTIAKSLGLIRQSNEHDFLLVLPEGTTARDGEQFWNASDACCDEFDSKVDDSTYLSHVITKVQRRYDVDPRRVFVVGFSNGGFMAHRMACDHADQVAAVVSIAGAQNADATTCRPSRAVSVLQVHGTADERVRYDGGDGLLGVRYPSAADTVATWRALDGCGAGAAGCVNGSEVTLWTVPRGNHHSVLTQDLSDAIVDWLEAHAGPEPGARTGRG